MTHETYINLEYASDNYRCLEGVGDWERRLNSDHPDAFKFKGGKTGRRGADDRLC